MSSSGARQEISENPSKSAVTAPTDPKKRDEDVDRKLRLYGIFQALKSGNKFPSNSQIDVAMNAAIESPYLKHPKKELSEDGQKLVTDLRDIIEQAKMLFLTKTSGDHFQKFLWYCSQASPNTSDVNAPVSQDQAKKDGGDILDGLQTLGTLIITNGQFRKLLHDATVLLRDMASDATDKAIIKFRPSEHELQKIDEPAADNTWHDVPNVTLSNLKDQWLGDKDDLASKAQNNAAAVQRQANDSSEQQGDNKAEINAGASAAVDQMGQRIPEEDKDKTKETWQNTKDYFSDKVSKERRTHIIHRLKKMIVEIQQHDDYDSAIETLLYLSERYGQHVKTVTVDSTKSASEAKEDNHIQSAQSELQTLLENFANYTSMDDIFEALDNLRQDAQDNPQFKKWFQKLNVYIRKCLKETGYVLRDESTREWNGLSDEGGYLLRERYREHSDRVLDEIKLFVEAFGNDEENVRFGNSVQKLLNDLRQDENEQLKFKPHLLKDIANILIPDFFMGLQYVPIPRLEVSDPQADFIIENLIIEAQNLLPNLFEIRSENTIKYSPRRQISNKNNNKFKIHLSQIQCDLHDVSYYIHRKQGIKFVDQGVTDFFMGGRGIDIDISMATADKTDNNRFFKIEDIKVKIHGMKINIKKSKHKFLLAIGKSLFLKPATSALEKIIQKQVRDQVDSLDSYVWELHKEVEKSKKQIAESGDPEGEARNLFSLWYSAIKQRALETKKQAKKRAQRTKLNVATTPEESLFPNIKLDGGISTRATEYKKLAREGENWQTPVYDIGSAKATADLPTPRKITRKSPNRNQPATINDRMERDSGIGYQSTTFENGGKFGDAKTGLEPDLGHTQISGSQFYEERNGTPGY